MALFSDGMAGLIGHGEDLRRERVPNESSETGAAFTVACKRHARPIGNAVQS